MSRNNRRRSHQCRGPRARNYDRTRARVAHSPNWGDRGPKVLADAKRSGALAAFVRFLDRQNKPSEEKREARTRLTSRIGRRPPRPNPAVMSEPEAPANGPMEDTSLAASDEA